MTSNESNGLSSLLSTQRIYLLGFVSKLPLPLKHLIIIPINYPPKMKKLILPVFVLCAFLATGLFESCTKENKETLYQCDTTTVSFSAVNSIFNESCSGDACHGANATANSPYSDYNQIRAGVEFGSIICRIEDGCGNLMPKGGARLSDCQLNTIRAWKNQGFRN